MAADLPKKPTPDRASPRVDFFNKVRVVVPEENTSIDVFASNVSRGGIFLRSNRPLPKGKKIALEFETKEGTVQVDEGEVVWNKPFDPISIDASPAGMGVQFRSMSGASRDRIEKFIDEAMDELHPSQNILVPGPAPVAEESPRIQPAAALEIAPATSASMRVVLGSVKKPAIAASVPTPQPSPLPQPQMEEFTPDRLVAFSPPRQRRRWLLFVSFVVIVAVATFATLIYLKPVAKNPGETVEPSILSAKDSGPVATALADGGSSAATDNSVASQDGAVYSKAAGDASFNEKLAPDAGILASGDSTQTIKPIVSVKPGEAQPMAAIDTDLPKMDMPTLSQTAEGWKMELKATGPVKIKHFPLNSPPRLAFDVEKVQFSGNRFNLEKPTPFMSRIRVGKQEKFLRFVIDFGGAAIPRHQITLLPDGVVVLFNQ